MNSVCRNACCGEEQCRARGECAKACRWSASACRKVRAAPTAIDFKQICKAWLQKKSCRFFGAKIHSFRRKRASEKALGCVLALKTKCIRRKMEEGQGHQFVVIVFLPFCKPEGQDQGTDI